MSTEESKKVEKEELFTRRAALKAGWGSAGYCSNRTGWKMYYVHASGRGNGKAIREAMGVNRKENRNLTSRTS